MKKVLRYILAVLWTAWTGALTLVTATAMVTGMFAFVNTFLNNNIVACVLLLILLVAATFLIGDSVKKRYKRGD